MLKRKSILYKLFALYMLCMTLIPCADACSVDSHEKPVSVETAQEHHHEHSDICSPFCSCACCSAQLHFSIIEPIIVFNPSVNRIFVIINQSFHQAIYFNIWQPPKIS